MARVSVAFLVTAYNQTCMRATAIIRSIMDAARGRASVFLVLVIYSSAGLVASALAEAGDYDLERLRSGEILLQTIDSDKPGGAARVTALFHTTADTVWNVIGYCKYELIYIRGLKLCEVLQPGTARMLMRHRLRSSWYAPTLDFTFEATRKSDNFGEAHLVEGDLKVLEGQWRFVPVADGSTVIVIHQVRIQPKIPAPRWLVRRSVRKDLPDMLACIRALAEASGDTRRMAADLKRCPGDISSVISSP